LDRYRLGEIDMGPRTPASSEHAGITDLDQPVRHLAVYFVATGSDARSNPCAEAVCFTERFDGVADDAGHDTPPASMSHGQPLLIGDNHGHTIGSCDAESETGP
jgi:hypothetical protein